MCDTLSSTSKSDLTLSRTLLIVDQSVDWILRTVIQMIPTTLVCSYRIVTLNERERGRVLTSFIRFREPEKCDVCDVIIRISY